MDLDFFILFTSPAVPIWVLLSVFREFCEVLHYGISRICSLLFIKKIILHKVLNLVWPYLMGFFRLFPSETSSLHYLLYIFLLPDAPDKRMDKIIQLKKIRQNREKTWWYLKETLYTGASTHRGEGAGGGGAPLRNMGVGEATPSPHNMD